MSSIKVASGIQYPQHYPIFQAVSKNTIQYSPHYPLQPSNISCYHFISRVQYTEHCPNSKPYQVSKALSDIQDNIQYQNCIQSIIHRPTYHPLSTALSNNLSFIQYLEYHPNSNTLSINQSIDYPFTNLTSFKCIVFTPAFIITIHCELRT